MSNIALYWVLTSNLQGQLNVRKKLTPRNHFTTSLKIGHQRTQIPGLILLPIPEFPMMTEVFDYLLMDKAKTYLLVDHYHSLSVAGEALFW
ncbi:hypothetical protein O6P43_018376 [Quillaja saponaria]|uniref:Uncharacterized protein n=1 Tax=Quillaja saponaria TaxID=32244 RepID=A0AAD7PQB6_QUISA|nr:hypothetical protein O6P43_018376 [Quillaja saponaria]